MHYILIKRRYFVLVGILLSVVAYVASIFAYAKGGYDGRHCAGLLDAVWKCNKFEYYLEWLLNPFSLIGLIGYLLMSYVVTTIVWLIYTKCHFKGL